MSAFEEISLFPKEAKGRFVYPPQELADQLEPQRRERLESLASAAADLAVAEGRHAEAVELVHVLARTITEKKAALPAPPSFIEIWRESLNR